MIRCVAFIHKKNLSEAYAKLLHMFLNSVKKSNITLDPKKGKSLLFYNTRRKGSTEFVNKLCFFLIITKRSTKNEICRAKIVLFPRVSQMMRKPFIKFICNSASYFTFLCEYFMLCLQLVLPLVSHYSVSIVYVFHMKLCLLFTFLCEYSIWPSASLTHSSVSIMCFIFISASRFTFCEVKLFFICISTSFPHSNVSIKCHICNSVSYFTFPLWV